MFHRSKDLYKETERYINTALRNRPEFRYEEVKRCKKCYEEGRFITNRREI